MTSRVGISQSTFWAVLAFSCTMEQAYSSCDRALENLRDERRESRTSNARTARGTAGISGIGENSHIPLTAWTVHSQIVLVNVQLFASRRASEKPFLVESLRNYCGTTLRTNRTDTSVAHAALSRHWNPSSCVIKCACTIANSGKKPKKHGGGGELHSWIDWEAGKRHRGLMGRVESAETLLDYCGQANNCMAFKADIRSESRCIAFRCGCRSVGFKMQGL